MLGFLRLVLRAGTLSSLPQFIVQGTRQCRIKGRGNRLQLLTIEATVSHCRAVETERMARCGHFCSRLHCYKWESTLLILFMMHNKGFPGSFVVKNPPACAGNMGSIPGSGRSTGEGNGNPLQCSCLGNPMDMGVCWATAQGVAKESDKT